MFAMDQIQSADLAAMALYFGPKRHGVFAAIAWYFHRNVTVFSPQWHGIFAARTQFSHWNGTVFSPQLCFHRTSIAFLPQWHCIHAAIRFFNKVVASTTGLGNGLAELV